MNDLYMYVGITLVWGVGVAIALFLVAYVLININHVFSWIGTLVLMIMSKHGSRAIGFLLLDCILIALLLSGGLVADIAVIWYWTMFIMVSFAFISGQASDIKLQYKPMWCRALTGLGTIAVACTLFYEGFYITFALYCISSAVIVGYYLFRRFKNDY